MTANRPATAVRPTDEAPPREGRLSDRPLLEARGCTVSFAGLKAVSDFSLQIAARTVVGLIGPNGAGKTTVFNMLTGIYQPTAGGFSSTGTTSGAASPRR